MGKAEAAMRSGKEAPGKGGIVFFLANDCCDGGLLREFDPLP